MNTPQINVGHNAGVFHWLEGAYRDQLPVIRADSRRSPQPIEGARAAIRQWAQEEVATRAGSLRLDSAGVERMWRDAAEALIDGLGWKSDAASMTSPTLRADSSWFAPEALTYTIPGLIRQPNAPYVVTNALPTRTVPSWQERFQQGFLTESASIVRYQPGQTKQGTVGMAVNYRQRPIEMFTTTTSLDWYAMMQSSRADFSPVAEMARIVNRTFAEFYEAALVTGIGAGTDWQSLDSIPAVRIHSTVDYSDTATTMDAMHSDLVNIVAKIRESGGYRETGPLAILIGSRWAARIRAKSNYNVGGSASGQNLLTALSQSNASLGSAMANAGIMSITEAPSLRGLGGADRDGMLVYVPGGVDDLSQVVAMAPAPVRTHSALESDQTLWCARWGGLTVSSTLSIGIADAQVA